MRRARTSSTTCIRRGKPSLREGRSAILTAGAPGAGKSTLLRDHIPDLDGYRSPDADVVKDHLIEQALSDGDYAELLGTELAEGAPLAPRELTALVHDESTALIDQIRRLCLDRGENVLIEGTLRWPGQGPKVYEELVRAQYTSQCARNAQALAETARNREGVTVVQLELFRRGTAGGFEVFE